MHERKFNESRKGETMTRGQEIAERMVMTTRFYDVPCLMYLKADSDFVLGSGL